MSCIDELLCKEELSAGMLWHVELHVEVVEVFTVYSRGLERWTCKKRTATQVTSTVNIIFLVVKGNEILQIKGWSSPV